MPSCSDVLYVDNLCPVQMDDETGLQPRLVGFDMKEPTAHNMGKPEAIATLRHTFPYETIVMVGDGITGAHFCTQLCPEYQAFCVYPNKSCFAGIGIDNDYFKRRLRLIIKLSKLTKPYIASNFVFSGPTSLTAIISATEDIGWRLSRAPCTTRAASLTSAPWFGRGVCVCAGWAVSGRTSSRICCWFRPLSSSFQIWRRRQATAPALTSSSGEAPVSPGSNLLLVLSTDRRNDCHLISLDTTLVVLISHVRF